MNIFKKIQITSAVLLVSASAVFGSYTRENQWYTAIGGTASFHNDLKYSVPNEKYVFNNKAGGGGSLAVGRIMNNWRLELEGAYRHNKIDKVQTTLSGLQFEPLKISAHRNTATLMGNVFYDVPLTQRLSWYLGAGAGLAINQISLKIKEPGYTYKSYSATVSPAVQAMTGLSLALTDNIDLYSGYRYVATFIQPKLASGLNNSSIKANQAMSHNVDLGLRFKF